MQAVVAAYGGSQARSQIGAVAAGPSTYNNARYEPHRSGQCWILNPLSKAGDQPCVLMDASQIRFLLSHNWNSEVDNFSLKKKKKDKNFAEKINWWIILSHGDRYKIICVNTAVHPKNNNPDQIWLSPECKGIRKSSSVKHCNYFFKDLGFLKKHIEV